MDAKVLGVTISKLRKKAGLTQSELAEKLNVSNKAVSRWENGLGFPEVTQFPSLAAILGVTVDYLMTGERKGITVAGSIVADIVKTVDCYPQVGMLANISDIKRAVGGCMPNTAIDLAKIDKKLPISVSGRVGDDEHGRFILSELSRHRINCERIAVSKNKPTSFSDVISMPSGERTFFHARGANMEFTPEDIDISSLNCILFHIGYILLLDYFDKEDEEYGTVMARFLHDIKALGIKTSIDVVSDSKADYKAKILPALKYTDYAIINEVESSMLSDLPPYTEDGKLNQENIRKTMEFMASCGVSEKVIIHCKEAGFCLDVKSGKFTAVPSFNIPKELIKGSVGAGDAYCAGSLYGIYNNYEDKKILEFASAVAACSLFAENTTDGIVEKNEIEKIMNKFGRKEL